MSATIIPFPKHRIVRTPPPQMEERAMEIRLILAEILSKSKPIKPRKPKKR